jgi:hypothetical protein
MTVKEGKVSAGRLGAVHVRGRVVKGKAALDFRPGRRAACSNFDHGIRHQDAAGQSSKWNRQNFILPRPRMRLKPVIDVGKATIGRTGRTVAGRAFQSEGILTDAKRFATCGRSAAPIPKLKFIRVTEPARQVRTIEQFPCGAIGEHGLSGSSRHIPGPVARGIQIRQIVIVFAGVHLQRQIDLPQLTQATGALGAFLGVCQRRQKHCGQDGDYGNHNE